MRRLLLLPCLASLALAGPDPQEPARVAAAVDAAIESRLAAAKVAPAPDCGDELFLRRVAYDLTGGPLEPERARAFLADRSPDKRARLVRELARSKDAALWWGRFLLETVTDGARADESGDLFDGRPLLGWLAKGLGEQRGVDAIVRDLLRAEGNRGERPEIEWLLRWEVDPARLAGSVGRDLLGVSIACAQCHDHPFDRWKQDDFWSLAAFFGRTRYYEAGSEEDEVIGITEHRRGRRSMAMKKDDEEAGDDQPKGERRPRQRFTPRFVDGSAPGPTEETRAVLGARVTAHPLFARNLVNRAWARMLGAGLVEPVNEVGAQGATALDGAALDALAERLRGSGHDLLDLVETIALTRVYARGPRGSDEAPLARRRPRSLSPDQLRTTLVVGLGMEVEALPDDDEGEEEEQDEGEDDQEMEPDGAMSGDDAQDDLDPRLVPEEEDGDLPRVMGKAGSKSRLLALLGGSTVRYAIECGSVRLTRLHGATIGPAHVEGAWLALLSRLPTPAEREAAVAAIRAAEEPEEGLADLLWSLLNSAELGSLW